MDFEIVALPVGVEVRGLDLALELPQPVFDDLLTLLHTRGVLLFREQSLSAEAQVQLASRIGRFSGLDQYYSAARFRHDARERVTYFTTTEEGVGTLPIDFHQEYAYAPFLPRYVMLYGVDAGDAGADLRGGQTLFVDAAAAVERLPQEAREFLTTAKIRNTSPANGTSNIHFAIQHHPATGRPYLAANRLLTTEVAFADSTTGAEMLEVAFETLYAPEHVYAHGWRTGDLLVWDNHVVQHGRAPVEIALPRELRRCLLAADDEPWALARS